MSMNYKKPDKLLIAAGCILLLVIFVTAGFRMISFVLSRAAGNFFYPYLKLAEGTTGEIRDKTLLSLDRMTLARQVEKLTERNRELVVRSNAANQLGEENRILRRKLQLSPPAGWHYRTAEIILRDPLHFRDGFTIDLGAHNGICPGDAVVDTKSDGRVLLIGVVRECSARTASALTVNNPELRISGRLTGNSVGFTNSGNLNVSTGLIRFGMLPLGTIYTPGEAVVTTGYENGIPEGIKIGVVAENQEDTPMLNSGNVPDLCCAVQPAVQFEDLRFVTVISRQRGSIK